MKNKETKIDINQSVFSLYFNQKTLKRIRNTKIMIIGCGGLGSNVATILVRTGFINLVLIDHDRVEIKNLNRQNYLIKDIGVLKIEAMKRNLLEINPKINLITLNIRINKEDLKELIKRYSPHIIVEAVDDEKTKAMIFETCLTMNKPVITANGVAGYGDIENIRIIRQKKYTIIGDLKNNVSSYSKAHKNLKRLPLAPKINVVAAIQADEVLRRVVKEEL